MKIPYRVVALTSALLFFGYSAAGTSRIDNEYFAFKPNSAFAVKSASGWQAPKYSLVLGLRNTQFTLDARSVGNEIPKACNHMFSVDVVKNPPSKSKLPSDTEKYAAERQVLTMRNANNQNSGCDVRVWLKPPQAYPAGTFGSVKMPKAMTYMVGVIEFKEQGKVSPIEFAIGVEDV